jgi:hypothetical protein
VEPPGASSYVSGQPLKGLPVFGRGCKAPATFSFRLKLAFCFWRTCRLASPVRVIGPKSGMYDLGLLVTMKPTMQGARLTLSFCQLQGLCTWALHKEPCRTVLVAEALLAILLTSDI